MSTISASTTSTTAYKVTADTTGALVLQTGATPTTAMTIDTSQNVGIGTSSPTYRLDAISTGGTQTARFRSGDTATTVDIASFERSDSAVRAVINYNSSDGTMTYGTSTNHPIAFKTNNTERARIDSSGNLLVGTTSASGLVTVVGATAAGYAGYFTGNYTATNNANIMFWGRNGSAVAAAVRYKDATTTMEFYSPTGHTVAYTTTSDYRIKEDVKPMIGALNTITQLKPVTYKWKDGFGVGSSQGFIAHELQEVVPDCVTGEKDAVDAEGNPIYQGIDTSFLVATLTAAIQEQQALITQLTERISALENK